MPPAGQRPVRIGCSGWNYASWKDEFYEGKPARLWLEHYAQYFDTVEVNYTFYRLPLKTSVMRWVEEAPPNFVFAVKASRYLTHVKRLTDLGEGIQRYYERLEPLARSTTLSSGSCRRTSDATTSGWAQRSALCLQVVIASSSVTRAGSSSLSTNCCANTVRRS
jgi:hypothetical protein